jgi:hypothetical protein
MLLRELTQPLDEKQVWARRGKKVVRKYRCVGGRRDGKVVAKVGQCYAAPDPKKRTRMHIMKARLGNRLFKKSKRTKRINPASRRVQALNKLGK